MSLTATGLSITYKRQEGSGSRANLTSGESVSGGVLTVSANKLAGVTSGMITYICLVTYVDPTSGTTLNNEASLTYTLITLGT